MVAKYKYNQQQKAIASATAQAAKNATVTKRYKPLMEKAVLNQSSAMYEVSANGPTVVDVRDHASIPFVGVKVSSQGISPGIGVSAAFERTAVLLRQFILEILHKKVSLIGQCINMMVNISPFYFCQISANLFSKNIKNLQKQP